MACPLSSVLCSPSHFPQTQSQHFKSLKKMLLLFSRSSFFSVYYLLCKCPVSPDTRQAFTLLSLLLSSHLPLASRTETEYASCCKKKFHSFPTALYSPKPKSYKVPDFRLSEVTSEQLSLQAGRKMYQASNLS